MFIYYSTRIIIIIRLFVEIGCSQNCGWPKHTLDIFFSIVLQNRPSCWVKRCLITAWHPFSCCIFLFDIRSIWFPLTLGGQTIEAGGVVFANFSINFASGSLWFVLYISKIDWLWHSVTVKYIERCVINIWSSETGVVLDTKALQGWKNRTIIEDQFNKNNTL